MKTEWEELTGAFTALDPAALFEDKEDIQEVEMDETQQCGDEVPRSACSEDFSAGESSDAMMVPSKWEKMERTEEKLCECCDLHRDSLF